MSAVAMPVFVSDGALDPAVRRLAIGLLSARLADAVDLGTQARQAQWNVKGPQFNSFQILFDGVHDAINGYVDLLAERVVQLGGVAFGTARQTATRSTLTEYPIVVEGRDHITAMTAVLLELGTLMRDAVEKTTAWEDLESAEVCAEVLRGIDDPAAANADGTHAADSTLDSGGCLPVPVSSERRLPRPTILA